MESTNRITYLGAANHRGQHKVFGIRHADRFFHMYVVGKTGTGKSHLLRTIIEQDLRNDEGFALIDPHGDLFESVREIASRLGRKDIVCFEPADEHSGLRFNPFAAVAEEHRSRAAAGLVESFKKLWPDEWGPRLEHLLRNVVYTLLEQPDSTFADIPSLLTDRSHRQRIASALGNTVVREFWENEFDKYSPAFRAVVVAPLQNKVGALLTDTVLRKVLTEPGVPIDLQRTMDGQGVLLVNLDKGQLGEGPSNLLGSLLVSQIGFLGLTRSTVPPLSRRPFFVHIDEFQSFTTEAFAQMLSELRKYRVGLTLVHQHLAQLNPLVRDAVFGNVGTIVAFRVGAADGSYLAREFGPVFDSGDLTSLPQYAICVKLSIDGATSRPFSAETLEKPPYTCASELGKE